MKIKIHRDFRPLVREMRARGYDVVLARSSHLHVVNSDGKFIASLSGSPSDRKACLAARTQLRRMGVLG